METGTNITLLENIIADQRKILNEVTGKKPEDIPQVWALYTEVQEYYDKGMRVPDDITLLLCDDNYGNIRRLPDPKDLGRSGGYGLYYHFDFNGGPWSYKWINTVQIAKVWEQLHLAYEHHVDRIWMVNVGDLKPLEFPISFYFDYAWDPGRWPENTLEEYAQLWAQQQFGSGHASAIGRILTRFSSFNGIRKPELMRFNRFSLINYREFESIVANYHKLDDEAADIDAHLSPELKDAYFELVLHPIKATRNLYDLYHALALNTFYATQGRAATNTMSDSVKECFIKDSLLTHYYNKILQNGKWNHMMDQTHISYYYWRGPEVDSLPPTTRLDVKDVSDMGVAIEGSDTWWPRDTMEAVLPELTGYHDSLRYVEVFNRGGKPFSYSVHVPVPWLRVTPNTGAITLQERLWVSVDWKEAPKGNPIVPLTILGPEGRRVVVQVPLDNREPDGSLTGEGFFESGKYVSISAAHYIRATNPGNAAWQILDNYGRASKGITLFPPIIPRQEATDTAPHVEYLVHLRGTGQVKVLAYLSPTNDYSGGHGLCYAIAFDDEKPHIINSTLKAKGEYWVNDNNPEVMMENIRIRESIHTIRRQGAHTLKFWIIDKGIVLQNIVVDCGGLKPSELCPPESYDGTK